MFGDLPLEIKLYVIELDPLHLIDLLLADKSIYEYYLTEEGKNWYKRILNICIIDTDTEKGITILNGLKHGEWKYYVEDKLIKSTWYKLGLKDGLEYIYYRTYDQVMIIKPYIKDVIIGTIKTYYDNGNLETEVDYDGNLETEIDYNGEIKHGKCVVYNSDGSISSRCTYNNGKLEGKYEKYYNNGDIQIQAYYEDGKRRALYDFNRINKKK